MTKWLEPSKEQLALEQQLQRLLLSLITTNQQGFQSPTSTQRIDASLKIDHVLSQAYTYGVARAQKKTSPPAQEAIIPKVKDFIKHAIAMIHAFEQRVKDWWKDHQKDTDAKKAFNTYVDALADSTSQYEIVYAVEEAALEIFMQEKSMIESVASPDCCDDCQINEAKGPIKAGETFPSGHTHAPFHRYCRCHTQAVVKR